MADPILVVGAGAQGLTFAWEAARRGLPVIVAEGARVVGGQARSLVYDGYTFDFGMHAFVSGQARVRDLVRRALGPDALEFEAHSASWLAPGLIVEDASRWSVRGARLPFFELFAEPNQEAWSCMRVQRPPAALYPRRGGFGRIFEALAAAVVAAGGRMVLNQTLGEGDLRVRGGRVTHARLRGRWIRIRGCYWSVGWRRAAARKGPVSREGGLLLYHFLLKGRAPLPYHWVRLAGSNPLLPPLVYYPARFSPDNAPRGCYSLGAAVPVPPAGGGDRLQSELSSWQSQDPGAFAAFVRRFLVKEGFLRETGLAAVRQEFFPAPRPRAAAALPRLENLWDSDRWLCDAPGESGTPIQMAGALRAADELLPALAGGRGGRGGYLSPLARNRES